MTRIDDGLDLPPLQRLCRRDAAAMMIIGLLTIVIGCGTFVAACWAGAASDRAALMALLVTTVWVALAPAPLAAGGQTRIAAICRGGVVADASAVTLIVTVLWGGGQITWLAAGKIYFLWAGMGLALSIAASAGSRRFLVAVLVAVLALATLSSRFWASGLIAASDGGLPSSILAAIDALDGVADAACVVWSEEAVLYDLVPAGQDYVRRGPRWAGATLGWWSAATLLGGWALARNSLKRLIWGT